MYVRNCMLMLLDKWKEMFSGVDQMLCGLASICSVDGMALPGPASPDLVMLVPWSIVLHDGCVGVRFCLEAGQALARQAASQHRSETPLRMEYVYIRLTPGLVCLLVTLL